jgi:hypothetical protein
MEACPRRTRTVAVWLSTPFLLMAGACGGGSSADVEVHTPDGFEPSPAFLATVADRSSAEAHRFEGWMSFGSEPDTSDPPFAWGAQDGDEVSMEADMTLFFEAFGEPPPPEFRGTDMTMHLVRDATNVYLRVPMLAAMVSDVDASVEPAAEVLTLFDDWVYMDLTRLTDEEVRSIEDLIGEGTLTPAETLDLVANAEDARELDPLEVRGEPMAGIAAEVRFVDILAVQGADLDDAPFPFSDAARAAFEDLTWDIGVWVDSEGYIGRIDVAFDIEEIYRKAVEIDDDPAAAEALEQVGEFVEVTGGTEWIAIVELFDYGDPDISIEVPDDATDITDDVHLLAAAQGP